MKGPNKTKKFVLMKNLSADFCQFLNGHLDITIDFIRFLSYSNGLVQFLKLLIIADPLNSHRKMFYT